jgi:hypothetical protein
MPPIVKKSNNGTNRPASSDKERQRRVTDAIEARCMEVLEALMVRDTSKIEELLAFFGRNGKAARWTNNNLMTILVQKPNIQRPVTKKEAEALGHTPIQGASLASIFVPCYSNDEAVWKAKKALLHFEHWCRDNGLEKADVEAAASEFMETQEAIGLANDEILENDIEMFLREKRPDWMADSDVGRHAVKFVLAFASKKGLDNPEAMDRGDRIGFKLVPCVFDLGIDTNGPAIGLSDDQNRYRSEQILNASKEFCKLNGIEVKDNAGLFVKGNFVGGLASAGEIRVARWMSEENRNLVLFHELAHHLLGDVGVKSEGKETLTRSIQEMRAEAVAYVVGTNFGMAAPLSLTYITNWGGTPQAFMKHLTEIQKASKAIILGVREQLGVVASVAEIGDHEERHYWIEDQDYSELPDVLKALHDHPNMRVEVSILDTVSGKSRFERDVPAKVLAEEFLVQSRDYLREQGLEGYVYIHEGEIKMAAERDEIPKGVDALEVAASSEKVKL